MTDTDPPPPTQTPALRRGWRALAPSEPVEISGDFSSLGRAAGLFEERTRAVATIALDRRATDRDGFAIFLAELDAARDDSTAPAAPQEARTLIYLCGAWLGEWLSWQAQAKWRVAGPFDPLAPQEPLACRGGVACINPFAWARQFVLAEPASSTAILPQEHALWPRCLPPRLLVAGEIAPGEAIRFLLPEAARRAMEIEELIGDAESAWQLYRQAYHQEPHNLPLLARMVACAWKLGRWEVVDRLSRVILSREPDHPQTNHNLAILYSGPLHRPNTRREAMRLFRRALAADPTYARAHLSLASCLVEEGHFAEAAEHARHAAHLSARLKPQAEELLAAIGEGQ